MEFLIVTLYDNPKYFTCAFALNNESFPFAAGAALEMAKRQNKTKQNKTKQNKTKQNKTKKTSNKNKKQKPSQHHLDWGLAIQLGAMAQPS